MEPHIITPSHERERAGEQAVKNLSFSYREESSAGKQRHLLRCHHPPHNTTKPKGNPK
jgi:hypothetical protein